MNLKDYFIIDKDPDIYKEQVIRDTLSLMRNDLFDSNLGLDIHNPTVIQLKNLLKTLSFYNESDYVITRDQGVFNVKKKE